MLSSVKRLCAVALFLSLALAPVAAQQAAAEPGSPTAALALGVGVQSFSDPNSTVSVSYQSLGLSPDVAIGKFGIGLSLQINYRFLNGQPTIRQWDWWPDNADFQKVLDLWLPKIKYVRWGTKGEPLFVKLGMIEDGTLGNGFIVGGYMNTLFVPTKRIFGLSADFDAALVGFPLLGLETFVGNLAQFDVIGARLFARPLIFFDIPVLKDLQIGATFAMDTQPKLYVLPAVTDPALKTAVAVYGADFRLPIIGTPAVSLAAFGDIASVAGQSMGGAIGAGGRLFGIFSYSAQLRVLGDNFLPVYFDATYDLFRAVKWTVQKKAFNAVVAGWSAGTGFSFIDDKITFFAGVDGPFNPTPDAANPLNFPHIRGMFRVKDGLVPGLSLDASYDKQFVKTFAELVSPANAAIQAKLNYKTGPAVISFVYKVRYAPEKSPDPWEITSGLESSIQLF